MVKGDDQTMAMTILNNSAAMMTLGELNKNINKVGKQLTRVATGQRIAGASDDAASFAISEKMREQIRTLEQDIQNVQNGSSMLRTAHGGIENIVEELRSLKELAIDSANDSNTDDDRKIIQKEFDKRKATIDEIATWTNYNGKTLLDGTYARGHITETHKIVMGEPSTMTLETGYRIEKVIVTPEHQVPDTVNITVDNSVSGIASKFSAASNVRLADGSSTEAVIETPKRNMVALTLADKAFVGKTPGQQGELYGKLPPNGQIAVKMDFTGMRGSDGRLIDFSNNESISQLNNQGFTILCSGCSQFINIKFNTESTETTYQKGQNNNETLAQHMKNF